VRSFALTDFHLSRMQLKAWVLSVMVAPEERKAMLESLA
jgi:hypothetical protein